MTSKSSANEEANQSFTITYTPSTILFHTATESYTIFEDSTDDCYSVKDGKGKTVIQAATEEYALISLMGWLAPR